MGGYLMRESTIFKRAVKRQEKEMAKMLKERKKEQERK